MTIKYTEEFQLTLKQIFILQEMFSFPDHEMGFWSEHDYLHRQYYIGYSYKVDIERSTQDDFYGLRELGLIESSDSGAEGTYFRCKISKKGLKIFPQIQNVDTSSLYFLRPPKKQTT